MKIYTEQSLKNFEFWSGAVDTVKYLTDDEMDAIEAMLEDIYPDGMTDTEINDFFWFDDDTIAEWLGYGSFEEIMNRDEDDEDEDSDEEEDEEDEEEEDNADENFYDSCDRHNCASCPYKDLESVADCMLKYEAEHKPT